MPAPGIPILMYHALLPAGATCPNRVHISVAAFEQQMHWLYQQGYTAVSLPELLRARPGSGPEKAVVITFDDGYYSLLRYAAPVLRRYGFRSALFLTTAAVGQPDFRSLPGFALTTPPHDRPLTWAEVRELQEMGWDVQAHSQTHANHARLPAAQLLEQLGGSRACIESQTQRVVQFYAFPYGKYNTRALQALQEAGYTAGFSVHPGHAQATTDPRRLPRLEINAQCSLTEFQRKVETGYASVGEQYRSRMRDLLFRSSRVKDAVQQLTGRLVN